MNDGTNVSRRNHDQMNEVRRNDEDGDRVRRGAWLGDPWMGGFAILYEVDVKRGLAIRQGD